MSDMDHRPKENEGIPVAEPTVALSAASPRPLTGSGLFAAIADAPAHGSTLELWGTKRDLLGSNCSQCERVFHPWDGIPHGLTPCPNCGRTFTHHRRTAPFPEDRPIPYEFPEHIGHA